MIVSGPLVLDHIYRCPKASTTVLNPTTAGWLKMLVVKVLGAWLWTLLKIAEVVEGSDTTQVFQLQPRRLLETRLESRGRVSTTALSMSLKTTSVPGDQDQKTSAGLGRPGLWGV